MMKFTGWRSTARHALLHAAVTVVVASTASVDERLTGGGARIVVEHGEGSTTGPGVRGPHTAAYRGRGRSQRERQVIERQIQRETGHRTFVYLCVL